MLTGQFSLLGIGRRVTPASRRRRASAVPAAHGQRLADSCASTLGTAPHGQPDPGTQPHAPQHQRHPPVVRILRPVATPPYQALTLVGRRGVGATNEHCDDGGHGQTGSEATLRSPSVGASQGMSPCQVGPTAPAPAATEPASVRRQTTKGRRRRHRRPCSPIRVTCDSSG